MLIVRLQQFPNQSLCIQNKNIYCRACSTVVTNKKSIIGNHCKEGKLHVNKMVSYTTTTKNQETLTAHLALIPDINTNKES